MSGIDFLLGLTVGLGIYIAQQYRFKQQLKKTLRSFAPEDDLAVSLPLNSLVRRELNELNRQRKKLEIDRKTWDDIIEKAPIGYLQVDKDNQLLGSNHQARVLLRIEPSRTVRVRLLLEVVRSYELDRLIERTRQSQQPEEKEWVYFFTRYVPPQTDNNFNSANVFTKIVDSVALKGYSFPLPDGQVGVFLIDRQPIIELSRSRDRTFSDLTHELRTPLTSISLVAENLLKRLQNPERTWVEKMLKETNRLIELVQEWLDLTQLEAAPNSSLKYESIELHQLILSVWQTLEPIARQKQVNLSYSGADSIYIQGDKSRLIQVFLNLLDNAIKHNPPQQSILVTIRTQASLPETQTDSIIIDVVDSGNGFAVADLPHIFERLYRGDKSRTRQQQQNLVDRDGSGLGLAIVRQIVESHGGAIKASNHPQTGGAWLQIILPKSK